MNETVPPYPNIDTNCLGCLYRIISEMSLDIHSEQTMPSEAETVSGVKILWGLLGFGFLFI